MYYGDVAFTFAAVLFVGSKAFVDTAEQYVVLLGCSCTGRLCQQVAVDVLFHWWGDQFVLLLILFQCCVF